MAHNAQYVNGEDYFRLPFPIKKKSKRIMFQRTTYSGLFDRWRKFRAERLRKKLEEKKERLVDMNFSEKQLENREQVERKVLRKTKAIAKLESKIQFLETGKHHTDEFIDSRAIKLKSTMLQNLVYNRDSMYTVNEKTAEIIMNDALENKELDEEAQKIGERVKAILAEKQAKPSTSPLTAVNSSDVAAAIDEEMNKINVEVPNKGQETVNKFINEDGTYRLRREDMDEDFRVTRIDRSTIPSMPSQPSEEDIEISPFEYDAHQRKNIDVDVPRKALTAIPEPKKYEFEPMVLPTIKMVEEENCQNTEQERTIPVVVPNRVTSTLSQVSKNEVSHDSAKKVEKPESTLDALMARVSILRDEQRTIQDKAEAANRKAASVDAAHEETIRQLTEYADLLEAQCNESYRTMTEVEMESGKKEAEINAMIEMMSGGESTPTEPKIRKI